MRRETHKICLSGISGVERVKAIDIISAAIAMQYHKNVIVLNEGYASDAAIDQIPESVKVFIVCGESKSVAEQLVPENEAEKIASGMEQVLSQAHVSTED